MLSGPIMVNDFVFYIQILKGYGKHSVMIFIHHKGDTVDVQFCVEVGDSILNIKYPLVLSCSSM